MSDVYAITDLDGYVSEMRLAAAKSIAPDGEDNLDEYISISQMKYLVDSWCVGYDNNNRPMLDEESNQNIFEDATIWMTNVGLAKLAAQNLIECAWDDKLNEMVFWYPQKEEPTNEQSTKPKKNKRSKRKDK